MSEFKGLFERAAEDLIQLYKCTNEGELRAFIGQIESDQSSLKQRAMFLCQFT